MGDTSLNRVRAVLAESFVLGWRTRAGRRRVMRNLDLLAVALEPRGWRLLRYYRAEEFPVSLPLLRVYASGVDRDVQVVVTVRAMRRGWGYFVVGRGRDGFIIGCGDAKAAAERVDGMLKHQMYPQTFPQGF